MNVNQLGLQVNQRVITALKEQEVVYPLSPQAFHDKVKPLFIEEFNKFPPEQLLELLVILHCNIATEAMMLRGNVV